MSSTPPIRSARRPTAAIPLAIAAALLVALPVAATDLTISDPTPEILFDDTDSGDPDFTTFTDSNVPAFEITHGGVSVVDVRTATGNVASSFVIGQTGTVSLANGALAASASSVGVGTFTPEATLHIKESGTIATQRLQAVSEWRDLRGFFDGGFQIDDKQGRRSLRIFPGSTNSVVLRGSKMGIGLYLTDPQAALHVAGSVRIDGDVALGSSRTRKTDFGTVDPSAVLARLGDLPVTAWRYRKEDESARHLGPFAEDFQHHFGLGDGGTISIVDAQGLTLAAIQALERELDPTDARIADLDARLAAIEERLAGAERRR